MPEKDPERAKRLDEVYKHLFAFYDVTSKTGFAKILGIQRTGLSSAFGGSKSNLTDNLFKKICDKYPGTFNLDYLLTGEGDLLTVEEDVKTEDIMKSAGGYNSPDATFMMSRNIEIVLKPILDAHNETVSALKKQIADKDAQIQQQADIIASLQKVIADLRSMSSSADIEEYISNNPFPIGVADKPESTRAQV